MTSGPKDRPDSLRPAAGNPPDGMPAPARPVWSRPLLTVHGDLRELTMGQSLPSGESGQPATRRPPP